MTDLQTGANKPLSTYNFDIKHTLPKEVDVTVFCLSDSGKVLGDQGIIFYNQPSTANGSVRLQDRLIQLDLTKLDPQIKKLAITATLDHDNFSKIYPFSLQGPEFLCHIETAGRLEAALILLEIYLHKDIWKIRCVDQGFNGGLHPLAVHYGVEITPPTPTSLPARQTPAPSVPSSQTPQQSAPPATPSARVNTVSASPISHDASLFLPYPATSDLHIHLDWQKKASGLFGGTNHLNLAAFIGLKNGEKAILQSLGDCTDLSPYAFLKPQNQAVELQSGDIALFPASHLSEIDRILLFAFNYDKRPDWQKYAPTLSFNVESHASETLSIRPAGSDMSLCTLANLTLTAQNIEIKPVFSFFQDHQSCDQAYGWGFPW